MVDMTVSTKGVKNTAVFNDAADKNVANYVFYGKSADSKIYLEADYKTQVNQSVIEDAFNKGRLIIVVGSVSANPIYVSANKVGVIAASAGTVTEFAAKANA